MIYFNNFSDFIREYVEREGITVAEFSRRIGKEPGLVYKWLTGERRPSLESAVVVADFFGVSLNELFGLPGGGAYVPGARKATFYERFEQVCGAASHYRVAKFCKLGQATISQWKTGQVPTVASVLALAKYFGCSLDYLVGRSDSV